MIRNAMPGCNLVTTHDGEAVQRAFHRELAKRDMARVAQELVAPLIARIGEAWSRNETRRILSTGGQLRQWRAQSGAAPATRPRAARNTSTSS